MNNRIIINADDCGYSQKVNAAIETCIQKGKITSTTIMANMDDFNGAVRLYNEYNEFVSFGAHLNLTEGVPLTKSQVLLDLGMFKEVDGGILFSGKEWRFSQIPNEAKKDVLKELDLQLQKIFDSEIKVSHIDSHHHIHTGVSIIPIIVELAKKYNIKSIRNIRNYIPFSCSYIGRKVWELWLKSLYHDVIITDYFAIFSEFYRLTKEEKLTKKNSTIELMVHPGGIYPDEEKLLLELNFENEYSDKLINYNQL